MTTQPDDLNRELGAIGNTAMSKLWVCPGPRGAMVIRLGQPRKAGRHLYWYIGRFEHQEGISGPVRVDEHPTFRTKKAAEEYLANLGQ
ncbi:hypothetical protein D3C76_1220430 [compost metagenome]